MSKSIRVSSNVTLILRLFIPTFCIVFFGLTAIALLFADSYSVPFPTVPGIRYIIFACFMLLFVLMYFTIMQLKRVELSETQVFVSNYFKTYAYQFQDLESVRKYNLLIIKIWVIKLRYKGKFGKRIPFILNKAQMNYCLELMGLKEFNEVLDLQKDI